MSTKSLTTGPASNRTVSVEARGSRLVVMPEMAGSRARPAVPQPRRRTHLTGRGVLPDRRMTTLFHTSHPNLAAALRRDDRWRQLTAYLIGGKTALHAATRPIQPDPCRTPATAVTSGRRKGSDTTDSPHRTICTQGRRRLSRISSALRPSRRRLGDRGRTAARTATMIEVLNINAVMATSTMLPPFEPVPMPSVKGRRPWLGVSAAYLLPTDLDLRCMRMQLGNGGWVRVDGVSESPMYVRFVRDVHGRWRVHEAYIDGGNQPLAAAAVSPPRFEALEAAVVDLGESLAHREQVPGPDLRRLAAHFAHTWGSLAHSGEACGSCGGPVKGGVARRRAGIVEAMQNWVAESWFAQFENSAVRQVPMPRQTVKQDDVEDFPVLDAPAGRPITDDFLRVIAHAYAVAVRKRVHPAPAIANLINVSPRTVQKWVAQARQRGILPPGRQGHVG